MHILLHTSAFASLILSGAIFGFFYAWVCSTMWGLDAIEPHVAIEAMNGMNRSVRNAVFAPAFFGTPLVMLVAAVFTFLARRWAATAAFAIGALIYVVGGMLLTLSYNVPMNEALAVHLTPADMSNANEVWQAYSSDWQYYNVLRTIASGVSLLLAGVGIHLIPTSRGAQVVQPS